MRCTPKDKTRVCPGAGFSRPTTCNWGDRAVFFLPPSPNLKGGVNERENRKRKRKCRNEGGESKMKSKKKKGKGVKKGWDKKTRKKKKKKKGKKK